MITNRLLVSIIIYLVFLFGMNTPALAAESWVTDPATGGKICWVSDINTLVAAKWTGSLVDGKADGKGSLSVTVRGQDGKEKTATADAEMKAGKLDGKVSIKWSDGNAYDGFYKEGILEGKGVYKFANGMSYDGDWKAGKYEGKGLFKWPNGSSYEGDFVNNRSEGKGVYRWPDGRTYEGDFRNDMPNGQGLVKDVTGKVLYQGEYRDGQPVNQPGEQTAAARGQLAGFLGIAWNTAKEEAEKLILARPNTKRWSTSDAQYSHFAGSFNDSPAVLSLEYNSGKFIHGCAWLPADEDEVGPLFDKMKAQMTDKYGKPAKESGKYLDSQSQWNFPAADIDDSIVITISRTPFFANDQNLSADRRKPFAVSIDYYCGAAQAQKVQQRKQTGGKDL